MSECIAVAINVLVAIKNRRDALKSNEKSCLELLRYCSTLEAALIGLKEQPAGGQSYELALSRLLETLNECDSYIEKFTDPRNVVMMKLSLAQMTQLRFVELQNKLMTETAFLNLGVTIDLNVFTKNSVRELRELFMMINRTAPDQMSDESDNAYVDRVMGLPEYEEIVKSVEELVDMLYADNETLSSNTQKLIQAMKDCAIDEKLLLQMESDAAWNSESAAVLGEGAFGVVYSGRYDQQPVAVKAIKHFGLVKTSKDRLKVDREIYIMHRLTHVNVIRFIGFEVSRGLLVTELARCSLHDALYSRDALSAEVCLSLTERTKLSWLTDIAYGLSYLHLFTVIHRDLKPQNVLLVLESDGSRAVAKISDFGSAKIAELSNSGTASNIGTLSYNAPELLVGEMDNPHSTANDMYAFGVLANELFTECQPWSDLKVGGGKMLVAIGKALNNKCRPTLFQPTSTNQHKLLDLIGDNSRGCLAEDRYIRPSSGEVHDSLLTFYQMRDVRMKKCSHVCML